MIFVRDSKHKPPIVQATPQQEIAQGYTNEEADSCASLGIPPAGAIRLITLDPTDSRYRGLH